jgi:adenylate cyclase class IV
VDEVKKLGSFMEIEAIDNSGEIGVTKLNHQCENYMRLLSVASSDLITNSYSDLMMAIN